MSKISLSPNASGTGTLSIASPSTNSDYTLTLPAETGTVLTSGGAIDVNASAPADSLAISSAGNVGIGTTSPASRLHVTGSGSPFITVSSANTNNFVQAFDSLGLALGTLNTATNKNIVLYVNSVEAARIDSSGNLLIGQSSTTDPGGPSNVAGVAINASGYTSISRNGTPVTINRKSDDGTLVNFAQDGTSEGSISVSGTTVSYNGGHLSRWAQTNGPKDDTLVKGTVLSNLDEMNVYVAPTTYWTEEDELPEGVNVGDVKVAEHQVDNEQLNKVKVSDVEGDVNVAGVFVNWSYDEAHSVDEINMAMTGDMIIRIAQGVTVQRGDLLMSAGDGTAKPQEDDIVRSKTIAKVTSTNVTCTYEDGSYCVPCVLMAC